MRTKDILKIFLDYHSDLISYKIAFAPLNHMLTILRFFAPVLVHSLTDVMGASICVIEASAIDFEDMKKEYGK